jgi:hypothetical protein
MYSAARTRALPPQTARLPRWGPLSRLKGGHSDQGSDLLPAQCAQLPRLGQQRHGYLFTNAGSTAQEFVLFPPYRAAADRSPKVAFQILQLLFQPCDVTLDAGTHLRYGPAHPVLLRHRDLSQLPSARPYGPEYLGVGVPQGSYQGPYGLAEVGQDPGVQPVGLGQLSGRLAKSRT